jgi:hypothetical protein
VFFTIKCLVTKPPWHMIQLQSMTVVNLIPMPYDYGGKNTKLFLQHFFISLLLKVLSAFSLFICVCVCVSVLFLALFFSWIFRVFKCANVTLQSHVFLHLKQMQKYVPKMMNCCNMLFLFGFFFTNFTTGL